MLTTPRDTKTQVTTVGEVALSIPSGQPSREHGKEKQTWGLGSGCNITKGFHLGRDKVGGHGRSGVLSNWSDDDYFTY
ncbi:hypothetical protein Tco_0682621 [Tanacetum coccineum]|uniref:Uncharacterized protein n=1 Tax=Tanacetum coccineum TaxID=301880 RepID=A0ABQ4XT80_9ASTR